jgi:hypothetical protein
MLLLAGWNEWQQARPDQQSNICLAQYALQLSAYWQLHSYTFYLNL